MKRFKKVIKRNIKESVKEDIRESIDDNKDAIQGSVNRVFGLQKENNDIVKTSLLVGGITTGMVAFAANPKTTIKALAVGGLTSLIASRAIAGYVETNEEK